LQSRRVSRDIRSLSRLRRGGRAGKAELIIGIEGVSNRPARKIVLRDSLAAPQKWAAARKPRSADVLPGQPLAIAIHHEHVPAGQSDPSDRPASKAANRVMMLDLVLQIGHRGAFVL
jgi:hypothetical protein